jgi:hypothetical protein
MQIIAYRQNFEGNNTEVQDCEWFGTGRNIPDNDFIVAYTRDGKIASRYGDLVWDFNAYANESSYAKMNFTFWCSSTLDDRHNSLIAEIKWLDFCNIWKRTDTTLAISTHKLLHLIICRIAEYAYKTDLSIKTLLSDPLSFRQMMTAISASSARNVRHLLFSLNSIDPDELGFKSINIGDQKILSQGAMRVAYEQTAPIPTRIYSKLLSCITSQLSETEEHLDRLLAIARVISSHPLCGRSLQGQKGRWKRHMGVPFVQGEQRPDFETLVREHNLIDYFKKYNVINVKTLSGRLSTIQTLCKLAIHAYTGMRDNEVEELPYGCLVSEKHLGQLHHLIIGKTYKFNSGLGRRAKWVAGEDAARGVRIAQRISQCAFETAGFSPACNHDQDDRYPLFSSILYFNFGTLKVVPDERNIRRAVNLHLKARKGWVESFGLLIMTQDILELNNMDPFRDWERKSYLPGGHWPLTTHQLRRSLALYASRSGLVSLPSLRRQLQHITQEMSLYYAKGSHFAKNFLEQAGATQRHFLLEVQETAPESEMLSFLVNVIESDERLYGGQGMFWQRQKERRDINIANISREQTLKEFQDGRRSFQVTPLGGCGKVGECNERAMGSFIACIVGDRSSFADVKPCKYSYITLSRIETAIKSQENRLKQEARVGTHTMYYKEIAGDLNILNSYREKISP